MKYDGTDAASCCFFLEMCKNRSEKKKRENRLSIQLGELFPVFELKFS